MNSNNAGNAYFGVPKAGGILVIVTAIYTVGNICGSFVAGQLRIDYAGASVDCIWWDYLVHGERISMLFMAGDFHGVRSGDCSIGCPCLRCRDIFLHNGEALWWPCTTPCGPWGPSSLALYPCHRTSTL